MSVAKVIEISAESSKSFEDAVNDGIKQASKSVHGIKSAWINGQQAIVDKNKVTRYRVDMKVSFVVD
ncbi:MAG: dodecin domain-containing protein [Betaproteobacteria bacterium]|nr:MAG: dodecin domain-containing protein [Betaproteobacteria bacterium]